MTEVLLAMNNGNTTVTIATSGKCNERWVVQRGIIATCMLRITVTIATMAQVVNNNNLQKMIVSRNCMTINCKHTRFCH